MVGHVSIVSKFAVLWPDAYIVNRESQTDFRGSCEARVKRSSPSVLLFFSLLCSGMQSTVGAARKQTRVCSGVFVERTLTSRLGGMTAVDFAFLIFTAGSRASSKTG